MMKYSVWLLTRPLNCATLFPPLAATSAGKDYLQHWGILVNEMTQLGAHTILSRSEENDNVDLGTIYELFQGENNASTVHITESFRLNKMREEWPHSSLH